MVIILVIIHYWTQDLQIPWLSWAFLCCSSELSDRLLSKERKINEQKLVVSEIFPRKDVEKVKDITDRKELHLRYTSAFDCFRNLVVRSKKIKMMHRDVAFAVLVPSTMRKAWWLARFWPFKTPNDRAWSQSINSLMSKLPQQQTCRFSFDHWSSN